MPENAGFSADSSEDGVVVVSIPVPVLQKTVSAPDLSTLTNGNGSGPRNSHSDNNKCNGKACEELEKVKTKKELLKSYRLHIFVATIFFITVLSVSLSWHFRNMAQQQLYASQAIFFNPRTRELTLSDPTSMKVVRGHLGQDIPLWKLPLHCPIVSNGDPHNKECLWKNEAILRINHFQEKGVQCYNISWESLGPTYVPHDCFYINTDKWYGPSNQSDSIFPISGEFKFQPKKNYTLSNNGIFSSIVDFYWLSSSGVAIYVNPNRPIQLTWNSSGDNQLCLKSNFSGPLYSRTDSYVYPGMDYTVCSGDDLLVTHLFMKSLAPKHKLTYPPDYILKGTLWSLKSFTHTENFTQNDVLDLILNATVYGFLDNQITLDGNWQEAHGDLVFDVDRFPNVTEMMETVQSNGGHLTLSISPYFQYTSLNFHEGIKKSVFVKDAGGDVTGLTNFQGGLAAVLDVFTGNGVGWFKEKIQTMASLHGIKSYRLTYGEEGWVPYKPHFYDTEATPNMYRKRVTESFSSLPDSSFVVEHTSDSCHVTSLIPVVSDVVGPRDKMCITGTIETALTLGLIGYPFVLADGIRMKSKTRQNQRPSKDLYIRWLQMAILFPAYKFSIVPWDYDLETVSVARNLTLQREQIVLAEMTNKDLMEEVANGSPILRPVWWLDPLNRSVHEMEIKEEFLIGNSLLVAPIMCEGVLERDIYVPPGVWEDVTHGTFVLGPSILRGYKVDQHSIPMLRRRKVIGEK